MPEEVLGKPAVMKVLVKEPNEKWHVQEIENTLESLQGIVGGHIETVTMGQDVVMICNEEGRILGLPYNCTVGGVSFCGTVAIVGADEEDFADCPDWVIRLMEGF